MRKPVVLFWAIVLLVVLLPLVLLVTPAYAIGNPSTITFGSQSNTNMYQVFENMAEDGDMLFVAETYIHYASAPTDYDADEAFSFVLLDTDGTTVLYSTPVLEYENYVASIYLTATQAASLTWESEYSVRLVGNPAIFGTPVEGTNMRTCTLQETDYITDSPAGTSETGLRLFVVSVAEDLEENDDPTYAYLASVQGIQYLTTTGANIFIDAIPSLNIFCPDVFQTTAGTIEYTSPETKEAYAGTFNYLTQLGPTIGQGVEDFGAWLGLGHTMAGIIIFFGIMLIVCGYTYVKTQNPLLPDAIAMALPFLGVTVGLIPLALAFTITLVLAVITLYYFFTRGVL